MPIPLRLLPVLPLLLLSACDEKQEKKLPEPVVTEKKDPSSELQEPLGEGILIPFRYHVIVDVTSGSDGRINRKVVLQTLDSPVEDAMRQLSETLDFTGFRSHGSQETLGMKLQIWSKDGLPLEETAFGISIQMMVAGDPADPAVTGTLTINIYRKAD